MCAQLALELGLSVKIVEPTIELLPLLKPPLACVAHERMGPPNIRWLWHKAGKEFVLHGLSDEGALENGANARKRFFFLFVYIVDDVGDNEKQCTKTWWMHVLHFSSSHLKAIILSYLLRTALSLASPAWALLRVSRSCTMLEIGTKEIIYMYFVSLFQLLVGNMRGCCVSVVAE